MMTYNPEIHRCRSIRVKDHDYSQTGAYFVSICAWEKENMFGEIYKGEMQSKKWSPGKETQKRLNNGLTSRQSLPLLKQEVLVVTSLPKIPFSDNCRKGASISSRANPFA
jgi:hypothetical protein